MPKPTAGTQDKPLTRRQDLVYKIFTSIISKQEIGHLKIADTEPFMDIAMAAADRILKIEG